MWPLSIIAIIVTLGLGYIWLTRGFFSSLIHLICTIIAGAIAFAVWEPFSYWVLQSSPTGGFMAFIGGIAWGVGLIVPFSVSLIVLRLIVDKLLPGNVVLQPKLDYIGGGVCGVMSGALTAGVLVIGLSFFRLDADVLGSPIAYGGTAEGSSIVRGGGLLLPVDRWTADLYGGLSERAFRTGEPLAKWHPDLNEEGAGIRLSAFEGRGRNTTRSDDFLVQGRFTVGDGGGSRFSDLLKDRWESKSQRVVDPDKHPYGEDTHIEGFVVMFKPSSKERDGKTAIGAGQLHLVLENQNEERMTVYPFAVSSQAESDKPTFARWRYDSDNVFIASVGAGAETVMAFEFPCPAGYRPVALYIKSVRYTVDPSAAPKWKFSTGGERDATISTNFGQIASSGGKSGTVTTVAASSVDTSEAVVLKRLPPPGAGAGSPLQAPEGMRVSEMLPFIIQKGVHGNLELDEENNKNIILRGDATLTLDTLQNKGLEKPLQIQRLLTTPDTVVVQLEVGLGTRMSILGKGDESGGNPPPALFDTNGTRYEPVGFIYQDETKVIVSFKPGEPITSMTQLPNLSKSRPAQKLTLIFRCSRGVSLKHFGLGTKALVTFDPPLTLDQIQGSR